MIPLPIPGVGRITLGLAGVLLVALVLGTVRRTSGIVWTLPLSANLVLRNFGLTVFLAQVGMSSGPKFAATIAETGLTFVLLGALIVLPLVVVTMIVGRLLAHPGRRSLRHRVRRHRQSRASWPTRAAPRRPIGPTSATR